MRKKIIAIVICLSMAALAAIPSTLAFFQFSETAHNVITTGNIGITIVEKTQDEDGTEIDVPSDGHIPGFAMPGDEKMKKVSVRCDDDSEPAWVRVSVEISMVCPAAPEGFQPDLGLVTLDYDSTRWGQGEDGYWYYLEVLEAGEMTEPLFTKVKFDESTDNNYKRATVNVDVKADAVQAANNPAVEPVDVWHAQGWPEAEVSAEP